MPPLPLTWKSRRGNSQIEAPDPNAGRAADYPNKWRVEFNKQTAKCMVCSRSLAGTKWCVVCAKCNKRFCIDCWTGQRFNKYGEKIFEGEAQNLEGCWCRFPTHFDPKWMAESEARTERMQKMIAEERLTTSEEDAQGRVAKRRKLDDDNDDNNDREQSPSSRILHPRDAARLAASGSKKRAALQADPDDEDTEQVRKDSQMPPIDHLEGKTTVVAGAGVIGLSIARELAAQAAASGTEHEIIVVEARDSYAQLASHDCAGLITKHGLPRKLGSLLSTSLAAWEQLLGVEEIREKVRFQQNGVIHVRHKTAGNSEHTAVPPSWYSASETEVFSVHRSDVGKM